MLLSELDDTSKFGAHAPGWTGTALWQLADAVPAGRSRRYMRAFASALTPGPFDLFVEGMSLRAYPDENYTDRVMVSRGRFPERGEMAALEAFLLPGATFVDIGANIGAWTLHAVRACPGLRVIAVEPHPETFRMLAYNLQANGIGAVTLVNGALGPRAGAAKLYPSGGGNVGQSSLLPASVFGDAPPVEVEVHTLGDLVAENGFGHVDVLKIDVEGFEDQVLLPFFEQAPETQWPRAIAIEINFTEHWQTDCLAALRGRGYETVYENPANVILHRQADATPCDEAE